MILNTPNRFEPSTQQKTTQGRSTSKRIAMLVFIAAGVIFILVIFAIITSNSRNSERRGSDDGKVLSKIIFPDIPEPKPEVKPEVKVEEPKPAPVVQRQPKIIRPAYIPVPRISSSRKQNHEQRIVAANAPTAIQSFGNRANNSQSGSSANPLAEVSRMLSNASGNAYASNLSNLSNLSNAGMTSALQQSNNIVPQQSSSTPDPNGWNRKDAFTKQALPEEYSKHTLTAPRSPFELKSGTLMPCVLISGLNSDLPGNITAQISENIYDTVTGRYLLVPRGSKLIGMYDNQISYGQSRVLVAWNRLIFPNGASITLDNLKGADQSGYSGFKGEINRHWGSIISSALLVSLLGAGVELAAPTNNDRRDREDPRSILAENAASAVAQAMTQIIQREANRQPTIKIKPGYRFMIFVQHDIIFPYAWRKQGNIKKVCQVVRSICKNAVYFKADDDIIII